MVLGEKIAIWGTGSLARKIYALYCDKVDVVCFYDSDEAKTGQTIGNVKVEKWSGNCEYKIVIASTFWREIAVMLNYTEFVKNGGIYTLSSIYFKNTTRLTYTDLRDFLEISKYDDYTEFIENEKIVVLYGNCQMNMIEGIMKLWDDFTRDYMIVNVPKVYGWIYDKKMMTQFVNDNRFWKSVDLFIYQTVSEDNKFSPILATDNIIKKLKADCKRLSILNLYYKGYFPQIDVKNEKLLMTTVRHTGLFTFRDKYVDALLQNGGVQMRL